MTWLGNPAFPPHRPHDSKREFSSLSIQETLHVAIFIEDRNAGLYSQFAELFAEFKDPDSMEIAATFWDMAEEERHHGSVLQERYFDRFGNRPCSGTEDEIREFIEVPKLANGEIFAITKAKVGPPPRHRALEVALVAEESARRYYSRLLEFTQDEQLRSLYMELAAFEEEHVEYIKRKMQKARHDALPEQA